MEATQLEMVIDPKVIDGFFHLFDDRAGAQAFVNDLINIYKQSGAIVVVDLKSAAAKGDFAQVGRLAHKLKGLGRNIGAGRLSANCQTLESDATNLGQEKVSELCTTISKEFGRSLEELEKSYYKVAG